MFVFPFYSKINWRFMNKTPKCGAFYFHGREMLFHCAFFHNSSILTKNLLPAFNCPRILDPIVKKVLNKPAFEQSWLTRGMSPSYCATKSLRKTYERRAFLRLWKHYKQSNPEHFPSFLVSHFLLALLTRVSRWRGSSVLQQPPFCAHVRSLEQLVNIRKPTNAGSFGAVKT